MNVYIFISYTYDCSTRGIEQNSRIHASVIVTNNFRQTRIHVGSTRRDERIKTGDRRRPRAPRDAPRTAKETTKRTRTRTRRRYTRVYTLFYKCHSFPFHQQIRIYRSLCPHCTSSHPLVRWLILFTPQNICFFFFLYMCTVACRPFRTARGSSIACSTITFRSRK